MGIIGVWRQKWQTQTQTQRKTLLILGTLTAVALVFSLPSAALSGDWLGLFLNIGTELGGAVVTFVLIDRIVGGGEAEEHLKADLIAQLGSQVNEEAIRAAEELERRGWLRNGSLKGMHLFQANLDGATLFMADLRTVYFESCNLRETDLTNANLQGSQFVLVELQGANLWGANLQEVWFGDCVFDVRTTLPDGDHWTPDTDLERFTDPNHSGFWRSSAPWSPTYRGKPADEGPDAGRES